MGSSQQVQGGIVDLGDSAMNQNSGHPGIYINIIEFK